jgi:hypothetical protein
VVDNGEGLNYPEVFARIANIFRPRLLYMTAATLMA